MNHLRNDKIKYADVLTGGLVKLLKYYTGCHIFYKTKNDGLDPNYNDENSDGGYKRELLNIIEREKIKVVIDIHGAAEDKDFDVDIGTDYGNSLNGYNFIPKAIEIFFKNQQICNIGQNKVFSAPLNTVTNYVSSKIEIPCIQLEINKKFRDVQKEENLQNTIFALIGIIGAFKDIEWDNKNIFIFKAKKSKTHIPIDKIEFCKTDAEKMSLSKNDTIQIAPLVCGDNKRQSVVARYKKLQNDIEFEEGCVYLTNRLFSDIFNEFTKSDLQDYIIGYISSTNLISIGIPKAGNKKIVAGMALSKSINPQKKYQLYNRIHDIDFYIDEIGKTTETTAPNSLFLDYYQRQLLNVNLPIKVIPANDYEKYENIGILTEHEIKLFSEAYVKKLNKYELKKEYLSNNLLINISKKLQLDKLELIEVKTKRVTKKSLISKLNFQNALYFLLKKLIGTKMLMLKVGRPYTTDESSEVVRLTPNVMKILGILESDKVRIKYLDKELILRAMAFDSVDLLKISNELVFDEIDANLIIGIPNQHRVELGIYSLNSIVLVERDMKYLFVKNSNTQVLPILGVVFTIMQTFSAAITRVLLICIFVPLAIFISLSQERAKIDNNKDKG